MKGPARARLGLLAFVASLVAAPAWADSGLPMIVLMWPAAWVTFLPVVVLEALVARRVLELSVRRALWVSFKANAASTLAGIPLAWLGMLLVEMLVGAIASLIPTSTSSGQLDRAISWVLAPIMAPWFLPSESVADTWVVFAAALWLCVPFFFTSVWLERRVVLRELGKESQDAVTSWSWRANIASYLGLMGGCLLLLGFTVLW